ncbi:hypothetical protein MTO96_009003 [Rhipicephalus appendiculatus]
MESDGRGEPLPEKDDDRIQYLREFLASKGVDFDRPCTFHIDGDCWLVGTLRPWNKILSAVYLELIELRPATLCLRSNCLYSDGDARVDALRNGAYLFPWLPKQHACVQSICLDECRGFVSPLLELNKALRSSAHLRHLTLKGGNSMSYNERDLCDGMATLKTLETFEFLELGITSRNLACGIAALLRKNGRQLVKVRDASRHLHFISDFPHLIKCLRNSLLKSGFNTPAGHVDMQHVREAYKIDSCNVTLKVMPGITRCHLDPNGFEKMRVSYAFQLFGTKVLQAFHLYKDKLEATLGRMDVTQEFFSKIHQLIRVMTSRFPAEALRPCSSGRAVLQDFLSYLKAWEQHAKGGGGFLSNSTAAGLRVLSELSFHRNHLNKDNIETLAVVVRSLRNLKKLTLDCSIYEDAPFGPIAKALESNASLEELSLNGCRIQVGLLFEALQTNATLRLVDLKYCSLNLSEVMHFAAALSLNKGLRTVLLQHGHLAEEGILALANAVARNDTLEKLDLSVKRWSAQAAMVFCRSLKNNRTPRSVVLGPIISSDQERMELSQELSQHKCHDRIALPWVDADLMPLTMALKADAQSLQELDLPDLVNFSASLSCSLLDALASNTTVRVLKLEPGGL